MNQRSKRARDRKHGQDIGASTMNTGGHVVSHRRAADPVIRTPQKATGDVPGDKAQGIAKASPFFKQLKEIVQPKSKAEEKKVIAEATEDPIAKVEEESKEESTEETKDSE